VADLKKSVYVSWSESDYIEYNSSSSSNNNNNNNIIIIIIIIIRLVWWKVRDSRH